VEASSSWKALIVGSAESWRIRCRLLASMVAMFARNEHLCSASSRALHSACHSMQAQPIIPPLDISQSLCISLLFQLKNSVIGKRKTKTYSPLWWFRD
jgi:hypothetical protein